MKSLTMYLILSAGLLTPALALAHPDHAATLGFADSFGHLFSSPDHVLMLLIPVVAAAWLGKRLAQWLRERQ